MRAKPYADLTDAQIDTKIAELKLKLQLDYPPDKRLYYRLIIQSLELELKRRRDGKESNN